MVGPLVGVETGRKAVNGVNLILESSSSNVGDVAQIAGTAIHLAPPSAARAEAVSKQIFPASDAAATTVKPKGVLRYAAAFVLVTMAGLACICIGNKAYAPEMYGTDGMVPAAQAHALQKNYAVFDLNLNIRALREEQLKRMTKTPDVIILGASHWQEAHKNLVRGQDFFNAHIHRDYWEDPLGMVELLVRHNRLPKKLIISIRDNQFTPVAQRKDFLWEPGIPAYREMSKRLGLETQSYIKTLPYDRARALISLPMLFENLTRWHNAPEHPGPSDATRFETLDALLPDGSIVWSKHRLQLFTPERTRAESLAFAEKRKNDPPKVEQRGVDAFETLLRFLKDKGVSVYLVNPPFNPTYYDNLQGTPYAEGLARIEALVQRIAADHDLPLFGSFNPHKIGCTSTMYIDAEHSNDQCLQKIFDQFTALDSMRGTH
jgi:hypothetical protein